MDGTRCPQHPHADLIMDSRAGDIICTACGLVVGDRVIDVGSEWRTFGNSDKKKDNSDPSRVGMVSNRVEGDDLSTGVSDMGGIDLPWAKLRSWRSGAEGDAMRQAVANVRRYLDRICSKRHLPDSVREEAVALFRTFYEKSKKHVRGHEPLAVGCLYLVCRNQHIQQTPKELATVSGFSVRTINRCTSSIQAEVEINTAGNEITALMGRFCSNLGMDDMIFACKKIAEKAQVLGLTESKRPTSITAATIYLVSTVYHRPVKLNEIARKTGAAEATIKMCYRDFYPVRYYLFPQDFKFVHSLAGIPYYGPPLDAGQSAEKRAQDLGLPRVNGEPLHIKTEDGTAGAAAATPSTGYAPVKPESGSLASMLSYSSGAGQAAAAPHATAATGAAATTVHCHGTLFKRKPSMTPPSGAAAVKTEPL